MKAYYAKPGKAPRSNAQDVGRGEHATVNKVQLAPQGDPE
jgi:hypothetical protein